MNSAIVAVEIVAKLIGEYRGDKTATGPISLLGVENARFFPCESL